MGKLKCLCDGCNWNKLTEKECQTADKEYHYDYGVVKCSAYKKPRSKPITQVEWMPENPCTPECFSYWKGKCKDGGRCDSFTAYMKLVEAQKKLLEYEKAVVIHQGRSLSYKQIESMLKQLEEQK